MPKFNFLSYQIFGCEILKHIYVDTQIFMICNMITATFKNSAQVQLDMMFRVL